MKINAYCDFVIVTMSGARRTPEIEKIQRINLVDVSEFVEKNEV